jgi:hypothetical protein
MKKYHLINPEFSLAIHLIGYVHFIIYYQYVRSDNTIISVINPSEI